MKIEQHPEGKPYQFVYAVISLAQYFMWMVPWDEAEICLQVLMIIHAYVEKLNV